MIDRVTETRRSTRTAIIMRFMLAASALLLGTAPALAIPSPDLVVGSLSSISQLIALGSAILGGGLVFVGARARNAQSAQLARRAWIAAGVLFLVLAASVGFNIYQYTSYSGEKQARLEDTLLRPARTPGGLPIDPEVKELSYGQQVRHPKGMTTEEADKLLAAHNRGQRNDLIFLDVRETAERGTGTLPGATLVRYPDIPAAKIDFTGKKAILFCDNGSRSHEVCEALSKQGIDCRFVVGGLEKWVTEGRAIDGMATRNVEQLREIPDYPNRKTLLETPEVRRLVQNEKAIFVDVRNPSEFAQQRLPGAINLAIRRIPTSELHRQIAELPKRPIVLPCYDRRGCFFADVLGLELSRAGYDVRGRYTLPWEYFVPLARPPHVEEWINENQASLWGKAGHKLADGLSWVSQWTGTVGAILLLALLSRLLVLPFSLKTERDQIRSQELSGELAALKAELKDDPVRLRRAIHAFYKRNGLTPVFNLLALFFLPIMALALVAVQEMALKTGGAFLWIPNIAARDPVFILPVLFGALLALYVDFAFAKSIRHRVLIWGLVFPLLSATGMLFSAGADIYLVTSAVLLLVQRAAVSGQLSALARRWQSRDDAAVSLAEVDRLQDCGNKAYRLARLKAAGIAVPDGVVLTSRFLATYAQATPQQRSRELDRLWARLNAGRVAVRSSGGAEDGSTHSFAGVFESVLNVDRAGLDAAIDDVVASFYTARARSYGVDGAGRNIIVQRMVDADYAGVMFTRDPAAGGLALVELVEGTAEGLVSGAVAPHAFRCGRLSGHPVGNGKPPIDLAPLVKIGHRAEELFGAPQDIEWTYRGGRFYIVQSRDITRLPQDKSASGATQREYARVLDIAKGAGLDEIVFAQSELSEMLPRPTPLSLSLMESLWASGGSVDLACRSLGIAYGVAEDAPSYLVTIFGRLYLNKREEQIRSAYIGPLTARRLRAGEQRIEREFREQFLPPYQRELTLREAIDFDRLSNADLFDVLKRFRDDFVTSTHVEVDIINITASYYFEQARKKLVALGLDPTKYLGRVPETVYDRALAEAGSAQGEERRAMLIASLGWRAVLDYELAHPRYAEAPEGAEALCEAETHASQHTPPADDPAFARVGKAVLEAVNTACRFEALKEDAKHYSLREVALLRRIVLAIDRRLDLEGLAFYLTFEELMSLREQPLAELRALAHERQQRAMLFAETTPLSPTLSIRTIEEASAGIEDVSTVADGAVRGTRVSGSRVVVGRARVVPAVEAERGNPIEEFADGDIVVSSMVHPAWLPYFKRAGGFVCEIGGWLSHSAILAREHDLPMIVGAQGLRTIADGSMLRLHPDGLVEIVGEGVVAPAIAAE